MNPEKSGQRIYVLTSWQSEWRSRTINQGGKVTARPAQWEGRCDSSVLPTLRSERDSVTHATPEH
jgi:hypothetical protein